MHYAWKGGDELQKKPVFLAVFAVVLALLGSILSPRARAEGPSAAPHGPDVAVLLSVGSHKRLAAMATGRYECGGTSFLGGELTVKVTRTGVTVSHAELGTLAEGEAVRVGRANVPFDEAYIQLDNEKYGTLSYIGDIEFSKTPNGFVRAVNVVSMPEYQYGVVGGELRASDPVEALKTQAVAAKGFALAYAGKGMRFDLDDTNGYQVYKGLSPLDRAIPEAVDEVADETLTYRGAAVKCFYCTGNGGQTLTPKMKWGGAAHDGVYAMSFDPYDLAATPDAVVWTVKNEPDSLPQALYEFLLALAREQAPRTKRIERIENLTGGTPGEDTRDKGRAPQERAEAKLIVSNGGEETALTVDFPLIALLEQGIVPVLQSDTYFIYETTPGAEWKLVFSQSDGHRVGMSHRGMLEMAAQGFTYREILAFYYPGAILAKSVETVETVDNDAAATSIAVSQPEQAQEAADAAPPGAGEAPEAAAALPGDVDGDGAVTEQDASRVLSYVLGAGTLSYAEYRRADADGSGDVTIRDAALIRRMAAGDDATTKLLETLGEWFG